MRQRLSEYLQAGGRVSEDQLAQARRTQKFFGGSLLYNLVRLDVFREAEAEEILAQWSGYPYAPLGKLRRIPENVLSLLEPAEASRRRIIPFQTEPTSLAIATSRVDNEPFLRELERRVGLPVVPHAILEERLEGLLERHYGIPAPRREAVRPVQALENPRRAAGAAAGGDPRGPDVPQVGLDGLPLESDVVPQQVLPSRRSGGISPLAEAFGSESPSPTQDRPPGDLGRPAAGTPEERLARALDRREIGRAAVELGRAQGLVRVVLFGHLQERLVGWDGGGPGIDPARITRLSIPLYTASIFAGFRVSPAPYVGIIPDQPANRELLAVLGGEPPQVVTALPIVLKDRVVAALYADGGPGSRQPADLKVLSALAKKVAGALEILLLRKKILS